MAGTLTITCLKPGGAIVVDGGRPGLRAQGVPAGGPADRKARNAANALLNQFPNTPCFEFTMSGGRWQLEGEGHLSLTGADMGWTLNGVPAPRDTALAIRGKTILAGGIARTGLCAYLAIPGEWYLPRTFMSNEPGWPGIEPITSGWSITVFDARPTLHFPDIGDFNSDKHITSTDEYLTVTPGPEWSWLTAEQQTRLLTNAFRVSPKSNRQGVRLVSENVFNFGLPEMLSSPVLPGTVQLAPSGPVVLGPAAQTVGGYPRVLLLADPPELGRLMQRRPGESVGFTLLE